MLQAPRCNTIVTVVAGQRQGSEKQRNVQRITNQACRLQISQQVARDRAGEAPSSPADLPVIAIQVSANPRWVCPKLVNRAQWATSH